MDYVVQVGTPASDSPIMLHLVFTDDGLYVPAVVRKPPGPGPFPAMLCMHGGSGGLGISWLVDQMLNRGFLFDRLLEEGYVVCYTEGRMEIEEAYGTDIPAVLDHNDLITTFRYIQRQPYVDPQRVGFFGVSHGGELQMKLISEIQEGPAALVPAEPAVIEYLGLRHEGQRTNEGMQFNADLSDFQIGLDRALERIQRISPSVPILVLGRDTDHLQGLFHKLYELLKRAGKNAYWESWDHPAHGYQWGPRRTETVHTNHEGIITEVVGGYQADALQRETLDRVVAFLNEHVARQARKIVTAAHRS
ncbi:MAG: alpha/beta hydrolase family protein [Dehalococcoidia bacterium]